jgi:colicin import membrane protein
VAAIVVGFDRAPAARLRPFWLRPLAAALAIAAHAFLLVVVLWPKERAAPAETDIEIAVVPQQMVAAEPAPTTSAAMPELSPTEAVSLDANSPAIPLTAPEATSSATPAEVMPSGPESLAPVPPLAPRPLPPPAVAAEISPPIAQADDAAIPLRLAPAIPAIPKPVMAKPTDDAARQQAVRQELAEQRRQALAEEKKAAERQAARREAAELARRQAQARESAARAAARPASLPPAQAPAGNGTAPSPVSAAAIGAYRGQVIGHLGGYKRYPEGARARGAEGRPSVSFVLDASGRVTSVTLTRSSGQPDIDAEVVAMVRRASPFPSPPPGAGRSFSATIGFVLH